MPIKYELIFKHVGDQHESILEVSDSMAEIKEMMKSQLEQYAGYFKIVMSDRNRRADVYLSSGPLLLSVYIRKA